ncbi:MAG TPA: Ig-like domain-containing protein, partial [Bordetella sp.]
MDKRIDVKARSGSTDTHTVAQNTQNTSIPIHDQAKVVLFATQSDIASMQREGDDLLIQYADGTAVRLEGYFDCPVDAIPTLVLDDKNAADNTEQMWKAEFNPAVCYAPDDATAGLVAYSWVPYADGGAAALALPILLGALGLIGGGVAIAAGGGGGGGGDDNGANSTPTRPAAPSAHFNGDGSAVIGKGEPNATIKITDASGQSLGTGTADGNGDFNVPLNDPQKNGEVDHVTQTTPGGTSPDTAITAPDLTAPEAPAITSATDDAAPVTGPVASGGSTNDNTPTLAGTAEPHATVNIYDNGALIGTATADASGNWTFTPGTALADGAHSITATATDAAGNTSPAS